MEISGGRLRGAVRPAITGADWIGRYASSPGNERCFCRQCGSPLAEDHSGEIREWPPGLAP